MCLLETLDLEDSLSYCVCVIKIEMMLVGNPDALSRYRQSLLESYIEDNHNVRWCPSVPHCGRAIQVLMSSNWFFVKLKHDKSPTCQSQLCTLQVELFSSASLSDVYKTLNMNRWPIHSM